ncbi:MAG: hypothetical protein QMD82_06510 [bacterium]|nr:hypothetical protein [bacterium]
MRVSAAMLLYSGGDTPQRTSSDLFEMYISMPLYIINPVITLLLFKNNVFLILMAFLFPGVVDGLRKLRFSYLERIRKPKTRWEEAKVYLIAELWLLLLLRRLKCSEIVSKL